MHEEAAAGYREDRAARGAAIDQRLAEIDQRLAELRSARPAQPGHADTIKLLENAQRHASEANRHWRETAARTMLLRQLVVHALHSAARAHEHAAEANEHAARAGIGDVAEHRRRAEFHWTAAEADRQRAKQVQAENVEAEPDPAG